MKTLSHDEQVRFDHLTHLAATVASGLLARLSGAPSANEPTRIAQVSLNIAEAIIAEAAKGLEDHP